MNRSQVAAKVAADKAQHPERYCSVNRCLWAVRSGKCPKHPHAPIHMGRVVIERDDPCGVSDEFSLPEIGE